MVLMLRSNGMICPPVSVQVTGVGVGVVLGVRVGVGVWVGDGVTVALGVMLGCGVAVGVLVITRATAVGL